MNAPGTSVGPRARPISALTERAARLWSDETVARRVTEGDNAAFAEMYRRFHQTVFRYCCSILRNEDNAKDALQSTMAKAMKSLPREERDLKLKAWLMRVARNECLDMLRAAKHHADVTEVEPASRIDVSSTAESRERLRSLLSDIDQLPERQRSALVMRELNDLSFDDIAGALGTTPEASRQTVYEARIALQDLEKGRLTPCHDVRGAVSAGDRRVLRGRALRSHLRGCQQCRAFSAGIEDRTLALRSFVPGLSPVAAASIFGSVSAVGASGGAGGLVGLLGSVGAVGYGTKAVAVFVAVGMGAGAAGLAREVESRDSGSQSVRAMQTGEPVATKSGQVEITTGRRRQIAGGGVNGPARWQTQRGRSGWASRGDDKPGEAPSVPSPGPESNPSAPGGTDTDQGASGPGAEGGRVEVLPVKLPDPPVNLPVKPPEAQVPQVGLPQAQVPPVNQPEVPVSPVNPPVKLDLNSISK